MRDTGEAHLSPKTSGLRLLAVGFPESPTPETPRKLWQTVMAVIGQWHITSPRYPKTSKLVHFGYTIFIFTMMRGAGSSGNSNSHW